MNSPGGQEFLTFEIFLLCEDERREAVMVSALNQKG